MLPWALLCNASPPLATSASRASWSTSAWRPAGWTTCTRRSSRAATAPLWRGGTRPENIEKVITNARGSVQRFRRPLHWPPCPELIVILRAFIFLFGCGRIYTVELRCSIKKRRGGDYRRYRHWILNWTQLRKGARDDGGSYTSHMKGGVI